MTFRNAHDSRKIRAEAISAGEKFYSTGVPCSRGHISPRYVSTSSCVACTPANNKIAYLKNQEERQLKGREWSKENPERRAATARNHRKKRPEIYAARDILKGVLSRIGLPKAGRTHHLLGYSAKQLKEHLENLFAPGMTWENRSLWHVDHKKSVAVFIKEGETNLKVINALSNLQPLWAADNMSKGAK